MVYTPGAAPLPAHSMCFLATTRTVPLVSSSPPRFIQLFFSFVLTQTHKYLLHLLSLLLAYTPTIIFAFIYSVTFPFSLYNPLSFYRFNVARFFALSLSFFLLFMHIHSSHSCTYSLAETQHSRLLPLRKPARDSRVRAAPL